MVDDDDDDVLLLLPREESLLLLSMVVGARDGFEVVVVDGGLCGVRRRL